MNLMEVLSNNLGKLANIAQIFIVLWALIFGDLTLGGAIRNKRFVIISTVLILIFAGILILSHLNSQVVYRKDLPTTAICAPGTITIDGSSALAKLVQPVASDYESQCTDSHIHVKSSNSETGKTDVQIGRIQIGDSDAFLNKRTQGNLIDHTIAVVVFALILNKNIQGVNNLTSEQIRGIYNGTITNWDQVGGPSIAIVPIGRDMNSGTHQSLVKFLLNGREPKQDKTYSTDVALAEQVQGTTGAIGYVDLITATKYNVQIISVDGIPPTDSNSVEKNHYKFWDFEHMYTLGIPPYNSLTALFIAYMYNPKAESHIQKPYFLKFNDMTLCATNEHNDPTDQKTFNQCHD